MGKDSDYRPKGQTATLTNRRESNYKMGITAIEFMNSRIIFHKP